ncbi:monocarboxylate transporter 5-like [Neocloeon triangulifer]|uniref:monocarboxylate transporter 5-like n=1 Tax=Neocloeon triangulifer TaxID=2078957 RepID=UPI00286EB625|nr:monocarboxylate transporter 5-like [Neocloeon triangulifer]
MARNHGKKFGARAIERGIKLEAPDGGWGWSIVLAFGVNHIFVIGVIQNFALIFSEKFKGYGITTTDLSLILNINSAVCNGLGLLNGPMLRKFSCRQVGVYGALLLFCGTYLTSLATTMPYFIISFGVVFGLGFALISPANSFSINSYFNKKRARAMGLAVTISGVGTVVMPLTVSFLLQHYTPGDTMLIVAALMLHCVPASLLLQPVLWHKIPAPEQTDAQKETKDVAQPLVVKRKRTTTLTSVDVGNSIFSVADGDHDDHSPKLSNRKKYGRSVSQQRQTSQNDCESGEDSIVTGSLKDFDDEQSLADVKEEDENAPKMVEHKKTFFAKVVAFFDLDLLSNPAYVITSAGIALAFCAEINFFLLTPVIFKEVHGFDTYQIAKYQSSLAAVDLVFRLLAPYIGEFLKFSNRNMYLISIIQLSLFRALIMIFLDYEYVIAIGIFLGMAKGVRTVFMPLILPALVPLHKLPSAIGLLMVMKSIAFMTLGPVYGRIRDVTGSFIYVVIAINFFTMLTALIWLVKDYCCRKKSENKD